MALSLFSLACAAAVACWDDQQAPTGPPRLEASVQRDTGLLAAADAWIEQDVPNVNHGTSTILRIRLTGKNRALLRWDQQTLQQVVGMDSLVSATLELTYSSPALYWEQGAKSLFLHRLTQAWTEAGATWNCAIDEVPSNGTPNCGGPIAWNMTSAPPIVSTVTASFVVQNGSNGVVPLDVTGDVRAWLAGTAVNHGWLLKKELENISGLAEFGSRESGTPPRLVLSLLQSDTSRPAVPSSFVRPQDSSKVVVSQVDTASVFYRHILEIRFDDSTSGPTTRSVLAKYQALIIGGRPGEQAYIVQIPDPGSAPAYDSVRAAMAQEPGVDYVLRVFFRAGPDIIRPESRYPLDGSQSQRTAWLGGATNGTRARRAVRAPLAWGCETGDYGSAPLRVGVFDLMLDSQHPDLQQNVAQVHPIPPGVPMRLNLPMIANTPKARARRHHGTGVSGTLTAVGDNGIDIAGMMWRSELHFFALSKGDSTPDDPYAYFRALLDSATQAGVRVLNVSLDLLLQDTMDIRPMVKAVTRFVLAGPGAVLVVAGGNDTLTAPSTQWAQGFVNRGSLLKAAIARIPAASVARSRILLVAGTNNANGFANAFSNFATGAAGGTDIAAPATDHLLLARRVEGQGDVRVESGTSFAAPLVAGVGGLLWSMDPTLTPEQVRDYILRGAREPRLNPQTGNYDSVATVTGAPGPVHLLDAYGAVTLLARERLLTPICGHALTVTDDRRAVVVEPRGAAPRTVPLPLGPNEVLLSLSVAQGGRRIAAHAYDYVQDTRRTVVTTQDGALIHSVAARRVYLERDTADIAGGAPGDSVVTITGKSDPGPRIFPVLGALDTNHANESAFEVWAVEPSPDGQYVGVALHSYWSDPFICSNPVQRERVYLFPLVTGTRQLLSQVLWYCGYSAPPPGDRWVTEFSGGFSWSHDGSTGLVFANGWINNNPSLGYGVRLTAFKPPSAAPTATADLAGLVLAAAFESNDSLVDVLESPDFGQTACRRQLRQAGSPATTVGSPVSVSLEQCLSARVVVIPNAPGRSRGFRLFADESLRRGQPKRPRLRVRVN